MESMNAVTKLLVSKLVSAICVVVSGCFGDAMIDSLVYSIAVSGSLNRW